MQIYNVISRPRMRRVVDPDGTVEVRHSTAIQAADTTKMTYGPTGAVYEIQDDGTFLVPEDVGRFFLSQPGWLEGPNLYVEEVTPPAEKPAGRPRARKSAAKPKA